MTHGSLKSLHIVILWVQIPRADAAWATSKRLNRGKRSCFLSKQHKLPFFFFNRMRTPVVSSLVSCWVICCLLDSFVSVFVKFLATFTTCEIASMLFVMFWSAQKMKVSLDLYFLFVFVEIKNSICYCR